MNIVNTYKTKVNRNYSSNVDFHMVEVDNETFVGEDKDGYTTVILKSSEPQMTTLRRKTKLVNLECNVRVSFVVDSSSREDTVHVLRCYGTSEIERLLFLELIEIFISNGGKSVNRLIEVFQTLASFFADKREPSDNELTGLYGELYAIYKFHDVLSLEKYWQSRDKLKFDFSFSDKLKLEVKATTKSTRTHHFRHDQLATDIYEIYVLSFMFRYDDKGLSLFDLIGKCRSYFEPHSTKLITIDKIIKNAGEERLKAFKYSEEYTETNRHFYKGADIPHFNQVRPAGVANAEYDCDLEQAPCVEDNDFIYEVKGAVTE